MTDRRFPYMEIVTYFKKKQDGNKMAAIFIANLFAINLRIFNQICFWSSNTSWHKRLEMQNKYL